ncbi:MAG: hypothetical protein A2504_13925 [Bdellovibrionales bacterium RIFOXYD12_FULL_39_22]|nr:MAG: hypothetical protein A2385_00650 [Bdellovibrionales bacterium RIFOXYB1_FULL_39_21]OFZ43813.1 MAG: hypothetical protein A2485_04880 [Bdellovibrionales bacterium RIFOXYC12_FULL_39_17]OFZ48853.1 MAG: hypothetical protein A2404_17965 [Bdellovibrionales bacterium RIFOXYC1_FULL_39_130]OFZ72536.1 MAG: hypothetical protein A2451_03635 [Bdellovibrionales bacterium RIFOXYC2_FULL_39_8]OFZ76586.1 MAG: hypothetical protein A2560_06630 [Bdellovibrionales bacterium RIFOXYD1_FULL_39_84]OFZ94820.1 MAG:
MKKLLLVILVIAISAANIFAKDIFAAKNTPAAVIESAKTLKFDDTRITVKKVRNLDGNPCMPAGESYDASLQVREAQYYHPEKNKTIYKWKVVKTVNIDKEGRVMEVCGE